MTRRIELEADGVRATLCVADDLAPKSAGAFWDALPLDLSIEGTQWSGEACRAVIEGGPLGSLPARPELGVSSLYRGHLLVAPIGGGRAEVLISFGQAELRGPTGRRYANLVAEPDGDFEPLARSLAQIARRETGGTLAIRRLSEEGGSRGQAR